MDFIAEGVLSPFLLLEERVCRVQADHSQSDVGAEHETNTGDALLPPAQTNTVLSVSYTITTLFSCVATKDLQ